MISKDLEKLKAHYGVNKSMCHDCAFRRDSDEVADFVAPFDDQSGDLMKVLDDLDKAVEGECEYKPFFCHQGMPTIEGKYSPESEADGTPIGFPICAGWLNEVMIQMSDERRSSFGKRFPSFLRVYDRVKK